MVYGNFARSLGNEGGGNFKEQVSESDAVLEFLMNECNNYNNLFVNESFVDDKERIVAEAKLQALQEAVTGAIIAAIIAVLTAVIALILKFSGMLKKGSDALKKKFSKEKAKVTLTEDQINEIKAKVKPLVDNINHPKKEMFYKYSAMGMGNMSLIQDFKDGMKTLKDATNRLINTVNTSSDVNTVKSEVDKFTKILEENDLGNQEINELNNQMKDHNIFFDIFAQSLVPNMADSVNVANEMLNDKYFDKAAEVQGIISKECDDLKSIIDKNGRKVQAKVHPDNHGGASEWNDISKFVNGGFKQIKDVCSCLKSLITQWAEAERFRLSYANILASYV